MIRKSMPSGYDPAGGYRLSLVTNAEKRLRADQKWLTAPAGICRIILTL